MQLYCENCKLAVSFENTADGQLICPECGMEVDRASIPPQTVIQGFRIDYEIGRGTSGAVYKARQLNLDRDIALKILHHDVSDDDEFVTLFFKEARAAASLSSPYIVQAIDAGAADGGIYYFAMELIDGENLEEEIRRSGALSPERGLEVALVVAQAMEYAWDRKQLTHGDIKPENILVNRHGEAKLADLGLAKIGGLEAGDEIMATPMYAPPEVISGDVERIGMASDIYSFGATVYHMFAGHPPFQEDDSEKVMDMHLYEQHVPLSEAIPGFFSQELSDLVDRMLEKNPEDRPASWTEIVQQLKAIQQKLTGAESQAGDTAIPSFNIDLSQPEEPAAPAKSTQKSTALGSNPAVRSLLGRTESPGGAEVEQTPEPAEPQSQAGEKSGKGTKIAVLGALAAGIVVVIGFFFMRGGGDAAQSSGGSSGSGVKQPAVVNIKNPAEERWKALKQEMKGLSSDEIIAVIKDFNKRYTPTGALKEDILKVLTAAVERKKQQLRSINAKKQRVKRAREKYIADVKYQLQTLNHDLALLSVDDLGLKILKKKLQKLLSKNRTDKILAKSLGKKEQQALKQAIAKVDHQLQLAARLKARVDDKTARLRAELKKRRAMQKRMDAVARVAKNTAAYFEMLNRVTLALRQDTGLEDALRSGQKLKLPAAQMGKIATLQKMLAGRGEIKQFFIDNAPSFVGLTIPGLPGNASTYKIDKIKESHVVLLKPAGGAVFGYKLPWSRISNLSRLALILKGLKNNKAPLRNKDSLYQIYGWLMKERLYGKLDSLLQANQQFSKSEKEAVKGVITDSKQAVLERAAWSVLAKMLELDKKQDKNIISLISDMTVQYSDTSCYRQNRQIILMLKQRYTPFARHNEFNRLFKIYRIARKRSITVAVNLAATMSGRFGMLKSRQRWLKAVKKDLFDRIAQSKRLEAHLPFMNWSKERLGSSLKYILGRGGRGVDIGSTDPFRLAAAVDNGLWLDARLASQSRDPRTGLFFKENAIFNRRDNSEKAFATMFGYGVIAYRMGKVSLARQVLYKMVDMVGMSDALKKPEELPAAGKSAVTKGKDKKAAKPAPKRPVGPPPGMPPLPPGVPPAPGNMPPPQPDTALPPGVPPSPGSMPPPQPVRNSVKPPVPGGSKPPANPEMMAELFPGEVRPGQRPSAAAKNEAKPNMAEQSVEQIEKIKRRLVLEYAILIGSYDVAVKLGEAHKFTKSELTEEDFSIAMLHLLALLQNSKVDPADRFAAALKRYRKLFTNQFADDLAVCQGALDVLHGKRLSPAVPKRLRLCRDRDSVARILTAAVACAVFEGNNPCSLSNFTKLMMRNVASNFASTQLWHSLLILGLGNPHNTMYGMNEVIALFKRDHRVVAIYNYPELIILATGVDIMNRTLPPEMLLNKMRSDLIASPVAGIREAFTINNIDNFSLPEMEKYLRSLRGDTPDFALLAIGMMRLISTKPADAVKYVSRNRPLILKSSLSWEKRLMFDNLMLWAQAWYRAAGR